MANNVILYLLRQRRELMVDLDTFKLFFDSDGNPIAADAQGNPLTQKGDIITALKTASATAAPVTDLWIFAYGWNNDFNEGTARYDEWHANMLAEVQRQKLAAPKYRPLFVEIFWPSKAWVDDAAQPVVNMPASPGTSGIKPLLLPADNQVDRQSFIDNYRSVMDPKGTQGNKYDADFGRIYDLLHLPQQPTDDEIKEFVQKLYNYRVQDQQSDPTEKDILSDTSVDTAAKRIKAKPLIPSQFNSVPTGNQIHLLRQDAGIGDFILENLLNFFRFFTFWTMKARSSVIGQNGVAPLLGDLAQMNTDFVAHNMPRVRIHLFGHSFGAKLCSAAVNAVQAPSVDTFVLLLGAFSQFSFSSNIPVEPGTAGAYASIVTGGRAANPLVVIYSQFDLANKIFYPLGMLASPDPIFEKPHRPNILLSLPVEPLISNDKFGSLGANGTQGLDSTRQRDIHMLGLVDMLGVSTVYQWDTMHLQNAYCLSVDGGNFINQGPFPEGAHNDLNHAEIFHLALSMSLRGVN
jgi:hypothetical protein